MEQNHQISRVLLPTLQQSTPEKKCSTIYFCPLRWAEVKQLAKWLLVLHEMDSIRYSVVGIVKRPLYIQHGLLKPFGWEEREEKPMQTSQWPVRPYEVYVIRRWLSKQGNSAELCQHQTAHWDERVANTRWVVLYFKWKQDQGSSFLPPSFCQT